MISQLSDHAICDQSFSNCISLFAYRNTSWTGDRLDKFSGKVHLWRLQIAIEQQEMMINQVAGKVISDDIHKEGSFRWHREMAICSQYWP